MIQFLLLWILMCILSPLQPLTFTDMSTSHAEFRTWAAERRSELQFRFKTHNSQGLLVYIDDSEKGGLGSSFLQLELHHGTLRLTIQMGTEDYKSKKKIQIGANLNELTWHTVTVNRNWRKTILTVGKWEESVETEGEYDKLPTNSNLFVGGIPQRKRSEVVNQKVLSLPRFIGCIENLYYAIGDQSRTEADLLSAVDVQDGCLDMCQRMTCANGGACYNWFNDIHCDCAGTGFEGPNCTVASVSVYLRGYNYITWNVVGVSSSRTGHLTIRFRTYIASGLLFAVVKGRDFLTVELHDGNVHVAVNLGGGTLDVSVGNGSLHDTQWHSVSLRRRNREVSASLDGRYFQAGMTPGPHSIFNIEGAMVYIGGHVNPGKVRESRSKAQFAGCLQHVYYNGVDILYKALYTQSLFVHLYGKIQEGCPIVKRPITMTTAIATTETASKIVVAKKKANTSKDANKTKEGLELWKLKTHYVSIKDGNEEPPIGKQLSESAIAGITVGIVVGGLFFAVSGFCLIHHLKSKYAPALLPSRAKDSPIHPATPFKSVNGALRAHYDIESRSTKDSSSVSFHM